MSTPHFYGLLVLANGRSNTPGISPELHLNVWERGSAPWSSKAFLDIGLMLDVSETANRFEFLLPWKVEQNDVEDLSHRVLEPNAVSAIFNEVWLTSLSNGSAGFITTGNGDIITVVHANGDLTVNEYTLGGQDKFYSIKLNVPAILAKSKSASSGAKRMYVRFRVKNVPHSFYRVSINPKDWLLQSSWQRTEIIDFRMNVRRGVPLGLTTTIGADFIDFSKVHLFLMKSRDQDIVFEDKAFRACRSLEDEEFWAGYSLSNPHNSLLRLWSKYHVKSSLGYQWSRATQKDSSGNDILVREFSTLSRFKKVRFGFISFLLAAAIVGAAGNAFWDAVKARYGDTESSKSIQSWLKPNDND